MVLFPSDMYSVVLFCSVYRIDGTWLFFNLTCILLCCVAVYVLRHVAVCCSMLQCVAICCSVLQCMSCSMLQYVAVCCSVLQYVAVCRSVCLAGCCSMLQGVALHHDGGKFGEFTVTKNCNTLQHMCT